ncbi:hypothetical protein [Acidithiobacillus ferrivorans]
MTHLLKLSHNLCSGCWVLMDHFMPN